MFIAILLTIWTLAVCRICYKVGWVEGFNTFKNESSVSEDNMTDLNAHIRQEDTASGAIRKESKRLPWVWRRIAEINRRQDERK